MEKVFCMNPGLGESSYARNSYVFQRTALMEVKPILEETIFSMHIVQHKPFCIADLGCSCGPNTLLVAEIIGNAIERKYGSEGIAMPEIQIFFNDLPSNDFNSVFKSIYGPAMPVGRGPPFFVAGVPGSFHGRLFPRDTLSFVHSSNSMHWLSKVPDELGDKNSEAWNEGNIFISRNGSPAVAQAYLRQFQKDFNAFLRARAQEMVVGGRMHLLFLGRDSNSDPRDQGAQGYLWNTLGNALNDLVSQGVVEEEKVDSFNLGLFAPSPEEVTNEVVAEGSFRIERLESFEIQSLKELVKKTDAKEIKPYHNNREYGIIIASQVRAVVQGLLEFHFGQTVIDELFQRFSEMIADKANDDFDERDERQILLLVVMERKK